MNERIENENLKLRVGTYNILHGADFQGKLQTGEEVIDLTLATDAIKKLKLDICGLNEVRNQENVEGLCNQARVIAEGLGYNYIFARAIDYAGGEYGNALVTRYPILSVNKVMIAIPAEKSKKISRYEDRVAIKAEIDVNGSIITVIVTHFGLSSAEIQLAVDTVTRLVDECETPVIFMGDLNITPDTDYYKQLIDYMKDTADVSNETLYTFPSPEPTKKIDYIMVNGKFKTHAAYVPEIMTSDHRPYVAEIETV